MQNQKQSDKNRNFLFLLCRACMLYLPILFYAVPANAQFSGGGAGTVDNPYKIATAADLALVRNFVGANFTDTYFALQNNINLNGGDWIPVGMDETTAFTGHFDGKGFKVQGFYFNSSGYQYAGLFGYNKGEIKNLTIEGTGVTNNYINQYYSYTGGLAGYNDGGNINNCNIMVDVTANMSLYKNATLYVYTGGLIGYNNNGSITNCNSTGTVTANADNTYYYPNSWSYAGGLTGYSNSSVTGCNTYGNVSCPSIGKKYTGGLIGHNDINGTVTECSSSASVSGSSSDNYVVSSYAGGLIGYNSDNISKSFAKGNVSFGTNSGGLIGWNDAGTINKCYATGNSSGSFRSGGLIGYNSSGNVSNCFATGNSSASGTSDAYSGYLVSGGFIGLNGGSIANCYATGTSYAYDDSYPARNGAFAGENDGSLSGCYYNTDVNGTLAAVGNSYGTATGLTTDLMKIKAIFVDWDFETVWDILEGNTAPYLMDMMPPIGGVLGGKYSVCNGSTSKYQYIAGESIYYWTVTGGKILSGQGTNIITVQWGMATGAGSVSLDYGSGTPVGKNVQIVALQPLPITGNMQTFGHASETYSVAGGQSSYMWTVTGGAITAGDSTESVTVLWDCNASERKLSLTYSNEAGCTATTDTVVVVKEVQPSIIGDMKPANTVNPVTYITEAGKNNYVWTVTNGVIQSGDGTPAITVLWNSVNIPSTGRVTVNYTDANGCSAAKATDSTVTVPASSGIENLQDASLRVYPNPVEQNLYIQSDHPVQKVEIYSVAGKLEIVKPAPAEVIEMKTLPAGIYFVKIYTNDKMVVRKIIKE